MDKTMIEKIAKAREISIERVEGVIAVCNKYEVEITGNIFNRTPEDAEKIILICREHNLDVDSMKTIFRRVPKEVEDIIRICEENNIPVEPIIFYSRPNQLKNTISFVSRYGRQYLKPPLLAKDLDKLKESMPYMARIGLLKYSISDPSVLELSEEEIRERTAIIMYLGYKPHSYKKNSQEDKLSRIYTYPPEKYNAFLEENSISEKVRKYQTEKLRDLEQSFEK